MNPWGDSWGVSFGGTYPIPADVRLGVTYGPTGTEYTGALVPGGGVGVGTYLFDEQTADAYRVLPGRIIVRM
jgi:hypothetical protein